MKTRGYGETYTRKFYFTGTHIVYVAGLTCIAGSGLMQIIGYPVNRYG